MRGKLGKEVCICVKQINYFHVEDSVILTFKISRDAVEELDTIAGELGVSRSAIIRHLVMEFIRNYRSQLPNFRYIKLNS